MPTPPPTPSPITRSTAAIPSAARIKAVREWLGLTQDTFADILSVTGATINRWERDHYEVAGAPVEIYRALERAKKNGATPKKILGGEPAPAGILLYRIFKAAYATPKPAA